MIFFYFFCLKNSEKNHWFQRYITTYVKEFRKWAKNVQISYFGGKLAVWPKNSLFWCFWPISGILWPRLLYTVGISDFFLNFWDQKKSKKSKKIFFLFNGPPYFQMKIADRNIEVRGPIFGMWPTTIIYNGNLSETKWSLAKSFFWRTLRYFRLWSPVL